MNYTPNLTGDNSKPTISVENDHLLRLIQDSAELREEPARDKLIFDLVNELTENGDSELKRRLTVILFEHAGKRDV